MSPVDPRDAHRIETELGVLLRRARTYLHEMSMAVHPELGGSAYAILVRLVDGGPARASDLVTTFGIDKAAVSRQASQLEALGLVRREPDPADGRAQVLTVTTEGRRRCQAARSRSQTALRRQLDRWEPEQVRSLGTLLEQFNALDLKALLVDGPVGQLDGPEQRATRVTQTRYQPER